VARHSVRRVEGGWRWKFDRQVFAQFSGGMRSIALPYIGLSALKRGGVSADR
jgi:hypothetical protein